MTNIDPERLERAENAAGSQGWPGVDRQGSRAERFDRLREAIGGNLGVSVATLEEVEDALRAIGLNLDEHETGRQREERLAQQEADRAVQEAKRQAAEEEGARLAVQAQADAEAEVAAQVARLRLERAERHADQLAEDAKVKREEARVIEARAKQATAELAAARRAVG
jgi:hypothetical protein